MEKKSPNFGKINSIKMRKILTIFIFLTFLFFICQNYFLAKAQEFNYARAYQDYSYNFNLYRTAYPEYISAKQSYLTYQTLTSKTEAMVKTLKMLQLRDEVIRTYLTALRLKLMETTGISNYEQNVLYLKLDNEVSWYSNHQKTLASAGTLEDLLNLSSETQNRYKESEIIIYQTLGIIISGREASLWSRLSLQLENLRNKISEIKQKGGKDTGKLERWFLETENRLTRSQEKQISVQKILEGIKSNSGNKNEIFNQAQFTQEESHQYLKEATAYFQELIREVKSADR